MSSSSKFNILDKKIVFVTGGVMSGIGKGIVASSTSLILKDSGLKISMKKMDPYINVGAGMLSPDEHGEVFVCRDGTESDLDLGNYMRMGDCYPSRFSTITAGMIYKDIIERSMNGGYGGKTVQAIPHVTEYIKESIYENFKNERDIDVIIVEIGGTTGDMESDVFIEAFRQLRTENPGNVFSVHVSYVMQIEKDTVWKTKPTQHSVNIIRSKGITPDILICRSKDLMPKDIAEKISFMCGIPNDCVIGLEDMHDSIYAVPYRLCERGYHKALSNVMKLNGSKDIKENSRVSKLKMLLDDYFSKKDKKNVKICIVGKYINSSDSYKSLYESIDHAAWALGVEVTLDTVFEEYGIELKIRNSDCVIIPGGFGVRGWETKKKAAAICYKNNIPCLGICFGMQAMFCAIAESMYGQDKVNVTSDEILDYLSNEKRDVKVGIRMIDGNLRLGSRKIKMIDSNAYESFDEEDGDEIFRHRYGVDPDMTKEMISEGLVKVIQSEDGSGRIDAIKGVGKKWFIGVQYHPELLSKPMKPRNIFMSLIKNAK